MASVESNNVFRDQFHLNWFVWNNEKKWFFNNLFYILSDANGSSKNTFSISIDGKNRFYYRKIHGEKKIPTKWEEKNKRKKKIK